MYTIEELSGPSDSDSEALGINAGGEVSGLAFGAEGQVGVVWSAGSPSFAMADGTQSAFYDINGAGDSVGVEGFDNSPTQKAVLVRGGVTTDLSPTVGVGTVATGINDAGLVCGWGWNSTNAFVFDDAAGVVSVEIVPLPGSSRAVAADINQTGEVVGTSDDHGFLYSGGVVRDLGQAAFVEHINEAGQVSGSIGKPWPQAFSPGIWDVSAATPTFTEIPVPASFIGGHASGINNKGDVVGTCWTAQSYDGDQTAYVYTGGSSTDLNALIPPGSGWRLQFAERINDDGQIAGIGQLSGQRRAFLLTPTGSGLPWFVPLSELVAILIFGGVTVDGGGWVILPGGPPIPVGPWEAGWANLPAAKRDALVGLALDEVAKYIQDRKAREAIRRSILENVRKEVDRMLETPGTGKTSGRRRQAAARLQSGKLPGALARFRSPPPRQT
jgi:probable HAF family extracellular repeat protein